MHPLVVCSDVVPVSVTRILWVCLTSAVSELSAVNKHSACTVRETAKGLPPPEWRHSVAASETRVGVAILLADFAV